MNLKFCDYDVEVLTQDRATSKQKDSRSIAPDNRTPAGKLIGLPEYEIPGKSQNPLEKKDGKCSIAALCVLTEDSVIGYAYPELW